MEVNTIPRQSISLPIVDQSQVGDARRIAARFTAEMGLNEHERSVVALVVTELGGNLVKYGQNGHLVLRALGSSANAGIEILSLDSGPGFSDVNLRVADGYSSGGTSGNGLGAVRRVSQQFDIYSAAGVGTAIMSRVIPPEEKKRQATTTRIEYGVVCVPIDGEEKCGDSWSVYQDEERVTIMVVDGLGHGQIAFEAADEAVRIFELRPALPSTEIMVNAHTALRSTRGAVMAVAETLVRDRSVSYTGVGNIAACILEPGSGQQMISLNGTIGLAAKPRAFPYTWKEPAVMLMMSDGLLSRWQIENFPGLLSRHPSLIAGMLYQHYTRGRDDVTVLAARWIRRD